MNLYLKIKDQNENTQKIQGLKVYFCPTTKYV